MGTVIKPEADSADSEEPRSRTYSESGDATVEVRIPDLPSLDEGRFQITGERARGGLGLVMETRDRLLGRRVALKQPHAHRPADVARFLREALITARLQHPAIVPIYDVGQLAGGEPCYTMRLVPGATLRDAVLSAKGLDERLALLPHVQAVADAVAYAHGEGILHRDLKPSNVLVGPFGETVVIDWGLAKDLRGDSAEVDAGTLARDVGVSDENLTRVGSVIGTPGYMPPEQARGEEVDECADVYAIGAMLYHLLTGEPPYPQDGVAAVLKGPPPPVEVREPGAPSDLVAIVAKAMAREPAVRYPNAGELAHDLKRFATGQLVGARRYSRWELARRFVRRNRATVTVAAGLVVALVAGVAAVVRERNQTARERNQTAVENNRLRLMQAQAVLDRDPTAAAAWLKTYRVEPGRERTAADVAARAQASGVARHVLAIPGEAPARVCLHPSGQRLGVLGREGSIWLFDLQRGSRRQLGKLGGSPDFCLFADDGRYLVAAALRGGGFVAARVPDGQAMPLAVPPQADTVDPVKVAGARLFVVDQKGKVHVVALDGGPARTLANAPPNVRQALPHPDGTTVYASDRSGGLWRVPLGGGASTRLEQLEPPIYRMDISPDGRELVLSANQRVGIRDLVSGQTWWHGTSGVRGDPIPVWWAQGGMVFISGEHRRDPEVKWWNRRAGEPISLAAKAFFRTFAVTRDGERAAWTDSAGTVRVADLPSHGLRTLVGHHTAIRGFDLSADGTLVAITFDRAVRVFVLPPSKVRRFDLQQQAPPLPVASAAGQLLAVFRGQSLIEIDPRTGQHRTLLELEKDTNYLSMAPSGRRVAVGGNTGQNVVLDLDSGRRRELAPPAGIPSKSMTFLDEENLVGHDQAGKIHLWNVGRGDHQVLADAPRSMIMETGVARTRARAIIASLYEVLVIDPEPPRLRRFDAGGSIAFRVALSPDGGTAAAGTGDGKVRVWELDKPGAPSRELVRRPGFISTLLFTTDGRTVVTGDESGSLYRVDLATGAGSEIGRHPARIVDGRLSPSGRWLATSDTSGDIRLWDPAGGGVAVLRGQGESQFLRFLSEDLILSVGPDGWLKLNALDPESFVPAVPAALSRWLDRATSASIDASGDPLSSSAGTSH